MVWGIDWGEEKTESQSLPLSTTSAPALLCVAFLSFPLSLSPLLWRRARRQAAAAAVASSSTPPAPTPHFPPKPPPRAWLGGCLPPIRPFPRLVWWPLPLSSVIPPSFPNSLSHFRNSSQPTYLVLADWSLCCCCFACLLPQHNPQGEEEEQLLLQQQHHLLPLLLHLH